MKAMILKELCDLSKNKNPLELCDVPTPTPKDKEILIKVSACGVCHTELDEIVRCLCQKTVRQTSVCHTELDEIEGRTPPPKLPIILGHEVIGRVEELGKEAKRFKIGDRVGVAWIYSACGKCEFCRRGNENLCKEFMGTGRDANGGYAQYMCVKEDFAYLIPEIFSDLEAAPLMCAGAIGYRSLMLSGLEDGGKLGLTGFGASAHIVLKMVKYKYPNAKIFVFARSVREREFAKELGAFWAGDTADTPPYKLDCIIDTTPAWKPVVCALKSLRPGGRLVINAIRKEERDKDYLLKLDYPSHLWLEKEIKSVANVCRKDVIEFLDLAAKIPIKPELQTFSLDEANKALLELKSRKIRGAKVLKIE